MKRYWSAYVNTRYINWEIIIIIYTDSVSSLSFI